MPKQYPPRTPQPPSAHNPKITPNEKVFLAELNRHLVCSISPDREAEG
uniref:BnaA03g02690D protein n=1 Tax=Rhizophora mucronata TaxID=61149 RepID=A0A2P2JCM7_RHIMU